jgi:hypothetical protein
MALFSTNAHWQDTTDDIDAVCDVVMPCFCRSGRAPSDVVVEDEAHNVHIHVDRFYAVWNQVFNQLPTPYRKASPEEVLERDVGTFEPMWFPSASGFHRSNVTLFDMTTRNAEERLAVLDAIKHLSQIKGQINVLLLGVGIDSITTKNHTWAELSHELPDVRVSMTSICPSVFSDPYPACFMTRISFSSIHSDAAALDSVYTERDEGSNSHLALRQHPEEPRWLNWNRILFQLKLCIANRNRRGQYTKSDIEKRSTVAPERLYDSINAEGFSDKTCKVWATITPIRWYRGSPLILSAVICVKAKSLAY